MALIKLTTIRGDEILVNPESVRDYGTYRLVVSLGQEYMVDESLQKIERMMLRDQFAMSALNGLLSNSGGVVQANSYSGTGYANGSAEYTALWAYELADAMLEERGKCTN